MYNKSQKFVRFNRELNTIILGTTNSSNCLILYNIGEVNSNRQTYTVNALLRYNNHATTVIRKRMSFKKLYYTNFN